MEVALQCHICKKTQPSITADIHFTRYTTIDPYVMRNGVWNTFFAYEMYLKCLTAANSICWNITNKQHNYDDQELIQDSFFTISIDTILLKILILVRAVILLFAFVYENSNDISYRV